MSAKASSTLGKAADSVRSDTALNGGNVAVLYCFVFLYIVFAGPGPWSVDHAVLKRE